MGPHRKPIVRYSIFVYIVRMNFRNINIKDKLNLLEKVTFSSKMRTAISVSKKKLPKNLKIIIMPNLTSKFSFCCWG